MFILVSRCTNIIWGTEQKEWYHEKICWYMMPWWIQESFWFTTLFLDFSSPRTTIKKNINHCKTSRRLLQTAECNKPLRFPHLQSSAVFGVSVFHNVKYRKMTQTTAWRNLSESRSEVIVQFSRVYLSTSCSTGVMYVSRAEKCPPPTQMLMQRHKHVFIWSSIEPADFHMTKLKKQWLFGVRLIRVGLSLLEKGYVA